MLYALAGFLLVPWLVRTVGAEQLSGMLAGTARVERVAFNPFTFALSLEGLELNDEQGVAVLAVVGIEGDLQAFASLFRDGWHLATLEVVEPDLRLEIDADGRLNLLEVLAPLMSGPTGPVQTHWPRIVAPEIAIRNAKLAWTDRSLPDVFHAEASPLDFAILDVDTAPDHDNPLDFSARSTVAERLSWTGSFRADPLSSQGEVIIDGLDLAAIMPFGVAHTTARVRGGRMHGRLTYDFAPAATERRATLTWHELYVEDLDVEHEDEHWIRCARVEIAPLTLDAAARTLHVERVALDRPVVRGHRDENGLLRVTRLAAERVEAEAELTADDVAERPVGDVLSPGEQVRIALEELRRELATLPWDIEVTAVVIRDGALEWHDFAPRAPVQLALTGLRLDAGPATNADGWSFPLELEAVIGASGRVAAHGTVQTMQRVVALEASAEDLDLVGLAPYVPSEVEGLPAVTLAGGRLDLDGTLRLERAAALAADWTGSATVRVLRFEPSHVVSSHVEPSHVEPSQVEPASSSLVAWGSGMFDGTASVRIGGSDGAADLDIVLDGRTTLDALEARLPESGDGAVDEAANGDWMRYGPARLDLGTFLHEGRLALARTGGGAARVSADFASEVTGVRIAAPRLGADRLDVEGIRLDDVRLDDAGALTIERIDLKSPRVELRARLPEADETAPAGSGPDSAGQGAVESPEVPGAPAVEPPHVQVATIAITDGSVTVQEESGRLDTVAVDALEVELHDVDSRAGGLTTIDVRAPIRSGGVVRLSGTLDPLDLHRAADLVLAIDAATLEPFDRSGGTYLGYQIDRGRMDLEFPVRVEDGRLDGRATVTLDTFYLGEKVDSDSAPDVPLKLGLDLMRGLNDRISAKLDVSGDLDDPRFHIGRLLTDAFVDIIAGAVASPFTLLAGAFGDDASLDLSAVRFDPGGVAPKAGETKKLDVLARALTEREAIRLALTGTWSPADEGAVRMAALESQLLERAQARDPGLETLSPAQFVDLVREAHAERFGNADAAGTVGTAAGDAGTQPGLATASAAEPGAAQPDAVDPVVPTSAPPTAERPRRTGGGGGAWPVKVEPVRRATPGTAAVPTAPRPGAARPGRVLPADVAPLLAALLADLELDPQALTSLADERAQAVERLLLERSVDPARLERRASTAGTESAVAFLVR